MTHDELIERAIRWHERGLMEWDVTIEPPPEQALFGASDVHPVHCDLPGGARVSVYWRFLGSEAWPGPEELCDELARTIPWEQRSMQQPGTWSPGAHRQIPMPRLECWLTDVAGLPPYQYSGNVYDPKPMGAFPKLRAMLERVNMLLEPRLLRGPYNAAFLNLYRDGSDSIGWHADDEPVLGPVDQVTIASVSLGAQRRFRLRGIRGLADGHVRTFELPGGSMLWMGPGVQRDWLHCVPKTKRPVGPRICVTFRRVEAP